MDRRTWQATVHESQKSWTLLSDWTTTTKVFMKRGNLDTDKHPGKTPYTDEGEIGRCFYKSGKPEMVSKPSKVGARKEAGSPPQPQKDPLNL